MIGRDANPGISTAIAELENVKEPAAATVAQNRFHFAVLPGMPGASATGKANNRRVEFVKM